MILTIILLQLILYAFLFSYYIVVKRLIIMTKAAAEIKKLKKALLAIHPIKILFGIVFLLSLAFSFSKKVNNVCWLCCLLVVKSIYIPILCFELFFELFLTC